MLRIISCNGAGSPFCCQCHLIGNLHIFSNRSITAPLQLIIRNNDINSRFLPKQKRVELDYYGPSEKRIYNSRTVDLVAHEVAHAIIYSVLPDWEHSTPETRGMEEAFCDLAPMFMILKFRELASVVVTETNGYLDRSSILSLFGVGHGYDLPHKAIRDALNNRTYNREESNPYSFASVLVGGLYDLLVQMYHAISMEDDVDRLQEAGRVWMMAIGKTYLLCHREESTLKEFVLLLKEQLHEYEDEIDKIFRSRKVL